MAEKQQATQPERSSSIGANDWTNLLPRHVGAENAMGPTEVANVWQKMYVKAGLRNPSEIQQKAFRMAVYVYCKKNGTSRAGAYKQDFILADGTKVNASVIPLSTGKMQIRFFMRGNMEESCKFLRDSKIIEKDEVEVKKAEALGITPSCAFAMGDWFADCPFFTPAETEAYDKSFAYSLTKARNSHGGERLEEVEERNVQKILAAQGRSEAPGNQIDF